MPKNKEGDISDDDVVISGMAGVFPEALNVNELKEKLFNNSEFIKVREDANWNIKIWKFQVISDLYQDIINLMHPFLGFIKNNAILWTP
uniref:Uncharacterized protein n=1 Tax=Timema douglasi TaxID=61478 RepID=A0A7R8VUB0_TIMDO|nr:unnamed protein product [Timema douglasi]